MIKKDDLKTALDELREDILVEVYEADSNAKNSSASEFYCSDQKGYSRGLYQAMNKIIKMLTDRYQL